MDLPTHDLHCEHCWQSYQLHDKKGFAEEYFRNNARLRCEDCGNEIDWWQSTLESIKKSDVNTAEEICLPIGARRSVLETILRANQITEVVFADTGIPADALILSIHYNTVYKNHAPKGSLQAVEIYQNPMERRMNPLGAKFYGIPSGEPPHPDAGLSIGVIWAPGRSNDIAWEYLINAFRYYLDDRYDGTIISANTSVETYLGRILTEFMEEVASKDNVRRFLQDGATYSHQLNVLLPILVRLIDAPHLIDQIRGSLNRLRKLRNALGHGEITAQALRADEVAESLCAAVFGLRYLEVFEDYL
jgi:hypothetical protein